MSQVYVQFLGFSANPASSPSKSELNVVKKHGGKVYPINKLPKGFEVKPSALGEGFLTYKGNTVFRIYWKKENGKWVNLTHGFMQRHDRTPKEAWEKHIEDLPWHKKSQKLTKKIDHSEVKRLSLWIERLEATGLRDPANPFRMISPDDPRTKREIARRKIDLAYAQGKLTLKQFHKKIEKWQKEEKKTDQYAAQRKYRGYLQPREGTWKSEEERQKYLKKRRKELRGKPILNIGEILKSTERTNEAFLKSFTKKEKKEHRKFFGIVTGKPKPKRKAKKRKPKKKPPRKRIVTKVVAIAPDIWGIKRKKQ